MVYLQKTLCLYDWLSFSAPDFDYTSMLCFLGLDTLPFQEADGGSKYHYGHRSFCGDISVHWSDDFDTKHNSGVFVEMSGQGCRQFEDLGSMPFDTLLSLIQQFNWSITRLDIAFDDRNNHFPVINIEQMAAQAISRRFTSRLRRFKVDYSCDVGTEDIGISVQHGSKSSEVYFRCYDKRVERKAFDTISHWVRFEIQLRGSACAGFVSAGGGIGERFRGVVSRYLQYRDQSEDTNKDRWLLSPWWEKFLQSAEPISICTKCEREYNKKRLDRFIYDSCYRACATEILSDGLAVFLTKVFDGTQDLSRFPDKYKKILTDFADTDLAELLARDPLDHTLDLLPQLRDYLEIYAVNDTVPASASEEDAALSFRSRPEPKQQHITKSSAAHAPHTSAPDAPIYQSKNETIIQSTPHTSAPDAPIYKIKDRPRFYPCMK